MKLTMLAAIVTASSFTLAPFALSETYRTEINASYGEVDSDYYYQDNYSISLQGTQYFSPVDTTNLPLAEAAFLQKASSFSLSLANNAHKDGGQSRDSYFRGAGVTYFIPDSIFFVGAGIAETKSDYDYSYVDGYTVSDDWSSRWNAMLGVAPIDGLQVWSEFTEGQDVSDYWNLNAKYVKPLAGERAFSVAAHYTDDGELDLSSVTVSADYYFNHRFSVGAGLYRYIADNSDVINDNNYHVRARHFITENTSLELSYSDSDYSGAWRFGGTVRF